MRLKLTIFENEKTEGTALELDNVERLCQYDLNDFLDKLVHLSLDKARDNFKEMVRREERLKELRLAKLKEFTKIEEGETDE